MGPGFRLPAALIAALTVSAADFPAVVTAFVNPVGGRRQEPINRHNSLRRQCVLRTATCKQNGTIRPFCSRTSSCHNTNNLDSPGYINMVSEPSNQHGPQENVKIPAAVDVQPPTVLQTVSAAVPGSKTAESNEDDAHQYVSFLDELLARCTEATRPGVAMESPHTGSSEWAGFRTTKSLLDVEIRWGPAVKGLRKYLRKPAVYRVFTYVGLLPTISGQRRGRSKCAIRIFTEGVTNALGRARQRSRRGDKSALTWSWLTLSPRPVRLAVAVDNPRFAVYLTVLPAGNGSPASHRPMYGCHMLSRVLAGEVEQVKSNSHRVIGRSTHSVETPVWPSYGGGARRLMNESFLPAIILEVVMYDWSRGSGYSGSYSAPGTSRSQSAERLLQTGEGGVLAGGEGERSSEVDTLVSMDECPCDPALLFRDGDVYEEEEKEEGVAGAEDLVLMRRDGKVTHSRGAAGDGGRMGIEEGGAGVFDVLTGDELACDVGGLNGQLEDITRRILATRSLPAEMRKALGVSHVRGLLLHGPPGCGKTLLARELSRRLGARPPKLVSGPEILDKWVGEAERKVRLLFLDAELEHERCVQMGDDPTALPLNLICFDEIDALCRSRGALSGDTSGVRDSVVNQILSKMDGLVNLQNVLVVGMTNRKELLDEALLRPGRMEVCMHIPLPDSKGRRQILGIHLRKAREAGLVSQAVDDDFLAERTVDFSGADLAGLVRSATSFAIVDWRRTNSTGVREEDVTNLEGSRSGNVSGEGSETVGELTITAANFEAALSEVQPSVRGSLKRRLRQRISKIVSVD